MFRRPLTERVECYLIRYGRPADGIVPIHPDECWLDKHASARSKAAQDHKVKLRPIGFKRPAQ